MSSDFFYRDFSIRQALTRCSDATDAFPLGLRPGLVIRHDSYEFGRGVSLCKVRMLLHLFLDANKLARSVAKLSIPAPASGFRCGKAESRLDEPHSPMSECAKDAGAITKGTRRQVMGE